MLRASAGWRSANSAGVRTSTSSAPRATSRRASPDVVSVAQPMRKRLATDNENAARRTRPTDVQGSKPLGVLHLIRARLTGRLQVRVVELTHARRTDRMAAADQATRRIDRELAVDGDDVLLDRLPRLARLGQAEVIDRHVFRGGETVVRLDAVELPAVLEARALVRIDDRLPRVRQHVWLIFRLRDLRI